VIQDPQPQPKGLPEDQGQSEILLSVESLAFKVRQVLEDRVVLEVAEEPEALGLSREKPWEMVDRVDREATPERVELEVQGQIRIQPALRLVTQVDRVDQAGLQAALAGSVDLER
jgi:hypothetical protein